MLETIQECYEQAKAWMIHLPDDADVNTVAMMVFKLRGRKPIKQRRPIVRDYDVEAVRQILEPLGDNVVEVTTSDFITNFMGADANKSYMIRIGKVLKHLGFKQYHRNGKRLYKLHALR